LTNTKKESYHVFNYIIKTAEVLKYIFYGQFRSDDKQ